MRGVPTQGGLRVDAGGGEERRPQALFARGRGALSPAHPLGESRSLSQEQGVEGVDLPAAFPPVHGGKGVFFRREEGRVVCSLDSAAAVVTGQPRVRRFAELTFVVRHYSRCYQGCTCNTHHTCVHPPFMYLHTRGAQRKA